MFRRLIGAFARVVLLIGLSACIAHGQAITREVDGIVADAAGALIPDVTVTLTDVDTNKMERVARTNLVAVHYRQQLAYPGATGTPTWSLSSGSLADHD